MNEGLIGLMVGGVFVLGFYIGTISNTEGTDMESQAIERGYALYCPNDGSFAWEGECEE